MADLKKYNLKGKQTGKFSFGDFFESFRVSEQVIKEYIVAIRKNQRQWSANTKGRSEVAHTTRKPFRQKGTGNARQGCLVSPQYRGGGVVFGPKPKFDQSVRINKKEKKAAIRHLFGEKAREDKLQILEEMKLEAPKTKKIAQFLKAVEAKGRVLFLGESNKENKDSSVGPFDHFIKSLKNIPKLQFSLASNVNGYDLILADQVFVTEKAIQELVDRLASTEKKGKKK